MNKLSAKIVFHSLLLILLWQNCFPGSARAQIRAGSAYLKILPGTRQQSLANSLTGGLDEPYSLYANPAATGLLREWQWSAGYTKWIADIFNASLLYGRQVRLNRTYRINFAAGVNYQGVDSFDATGGKQPPASANDLLLTSSFGFPITSVAGNFALGANIKYFRTELNQHHASTVAFDFGALYRSDRIRLHESNSGLFDYAIISAGVSLNHLGPAMKFISAKTPLPRTFRAGLALNLGTHNGIQIQLAGDYQRVKDEVSRFSLGTELINIFSPISNKLGRLISLRGGYTFNSRQQDDFVSRLSIGLSIRFDDYMYSNKNILSPRNTALRFDVGALQSNKFSGVRQGSATYRPIGPEYFAFASSDSSFSLAVQKTPDHLFRVCDAINLSWESTQDPDLYDEVNYLVLMAREDSAQLKHIIEKAKINLINDFWLRKYSKHTKGRDSSEVRFLYLKSAGSALTNGKAPEIKTLLDSTFHVSQRAPTLDYTLLPEFTFNGKSSCGTVMNKFHTAGNYYWTVLAYDRDRHFRVIESPGKHIARFSIKPEPNLLMTTRPVKTPGGYLAEVTLQNNGAAELTGEMRLELTTLPVSSSAAQPIVAKPDTTIIISHLPPGATRIDSVRWDGNHQFLFAELDPDTVIFCCGPKISIDTLAYYDIELHKTAITVSPGINIEFTVNDSLPRRGEAQRLSELPLNALREALNNSNLFPAGVYLEIAGHTDERGRTGYNDTLSANRANWVKNYLIRKFGFDPARICAIGYGESEPINPEVNEQYNSKLITWEQRADLHRQNRRVEFSIKTGSAPCSPDSQPVNFVFPKNTITYELKMINNGPDTARNVHVFDQLPAYLNPVTPGAGNLVIDELPPAPSPFSTRTIKYKTIVKNNLAAAVREIVNTARLSDPFDINSINNSASSRVIAIDMIVPSTYFDLDLSGRFLQNGVETDSIKAGDKVQYQLMIQNNGPATAYNVRFNIPRFRYLSVTRRQFSRLPDKIWQTSISWDSLFAGSTITLTYDVKSTQAISDSLKSILLQSSIFAFDDTSLANNSRIDTIHVIHSPNPDPELQTVWIEGQGEVKTELVARHNFVEGTEVLATLRYQWFRRKPGDSRYTKIESARGRIYKLSKRDRAHFIKVEVSTINHRGRTTSRKSTSLTAVIKPFRRR